MTVERPCRERLPARLRALLAEALRSPRGASGLHLRLGLPAEGLDRRLAELRRRGLARAATVFDPGRCGRPVEGRILVRLVAADPVAAAGFERMLLADPDVLQAARICGRFDYELATAHADLRAATLWRRALEGRGEVARVEQRLVRTLFGHGLGGLPLGWPP